MTHSPEQVFTSEYYKSEGVESLNLSDIFIGDQVLIYFDDGRAFWLNIDQQDAEGNLSAKAIFGRKSQFAPEIERWEEYPHRLQIKGSCEGIKVEMGGISVVAENLDSFEAGKFAWFTFMSDRGEKPLLSPFPIKVIKIERQAVNENNAGIAENLIL